MAERKDLCAAKKKKKKNYQGYGLPICSWEEMASHERCQYDFRPPTYIQDYHIA